LDNVKSTTEDSKCHPRLDRINVSQAESPPQHGADNNVNFN
jgi:hypothetical protein